LRLARLCRILRLVRLVKSIPPLYQLAKGIIESMQGMIWVLLLTSTVLYLSALLCTKLIGHGMILGGIDLEEYPDVPLAFPTVPNSFFNLFKVMNADLGPVEPLLAPDFPYSSTARFVIMAFMIITNWAIFSILTAVVSDKMAGVSEDEDQKSAEEADKWKSVDTTVKLERIFVNLDPDGLSGITQNTFQTLLDDEKQSMELCEAAGLQESDLQDLFVILSRQSAADAEPKIYHKEFMEGLSRERAPMTERSMMRLEKRMSDLESQLCRRMTVLQGQLEQL